MEARIQIMRYLVTLEKKSQNFLLNSLILQFLDDPYYLRVFWRTSASWFRISGCSRFSIFRIETNLFINGTQMKISLRKWNLDLILLEGLINSHTYSTFCAETHVESSPK